MTRKIFDSDIDNIIKLHASGITVHDIADRYGVDRHTIWAILRKRGIHPTNKVRSINRPAVIKMFNAGATVASIADTFHVSKHLISDILHEAGISLPGRTIHFDSSTISTIVSAYTSGASEYALSKQYGVSRSVIRRILQQSHIVIRGCSESQKLRFAHATKSEKLVITEAAHKAVRGKPQSHERLCKRALTVQRKFSGFSSFYEQDVADELARRGIKFIPQFAIDKYNVDFSLWDNIALEIYGGGWHSTGRAAARFDQRSKEIFSHGYAIVICWITMSTRFSPSGIVDYLVSLNEVLRSDPSARCKHYVIGCNGEPGAIGKEHLHYVT